MELIDAKLITPENRGLPEIDGAPIKTEHPCQKCGKPVNLLDDSPRMTLRGNYKDSEGNQIGDFYLRNLNEPWPLLR